MIDTAEQKIIDSSENCILDPTKVFVCQAIRSTLKNLLASILENDTEICDAFEVVVAQVVGTGSLAMEIAKIPVSGRAMLTPCKTSLSVVQIAL